MSSELFRCELRSRAGWPSPLVADSEDELIDQLRERFRSEAILDSFAIVFEAPVPAELRERITSTVLDAVKAHATARWGDLEWIDHLVKETSWGGVQVFIDPGLAPCYAGGGEEWDDPVLGLWADDRTFLQVDAGSVRYSSPHRTSWDATWVHLSHWQPNSMTSGYGADSLFEIGAGAGATALVGLRNLDELGVEYSVSPRPGDAAAAARVVADFIEGGWLAGISGHIVPLLAHGLPADGSAGDFTVDLLPGSDNPGYEISTLRVTPPDDVMAELLALGTLDARGARRLRDAIAAGLREERGPEVVLDDLEDVWARVLVRLDEVCR